MFAVTAIAAVAACNVSYGVVDLNAEGTRCSTCADPLAEPVVEVQEDAGFTSVRASSTDTDGDAGSTPPSDHTVRDAGPDSAVDAGQPPAPLSPVVSAIRLNGVTQSSVQVAWNAAVNLTFTVFNSPTSCRLDTTNLAGTSASMTAPGTNGSYVHTITCSNTAGSGSATFTIVAQDVGRWFQANSQNCPTFCAAQGARTNVQSPYGARCASGERQVPWPADQGNYGDFSYTYGVWPGRIAANTTFTIDTSSNGNYCYSPGQGTDGDGTDITVACFCKKL